MSIPGSASPLFFTAAAEAAAAGPIKSVRFNADDSAYLNRTPSSAGNRKTFTLSGWIKRSSFGVQRGIFSTYAGAHPTTALVFSASDELWFFDYNSSYNLQLKTSAVFRDPSAWLHFVIAVDTTQATASNRVKIYINGEQVTAFGTSTYPSQDFELDWNSTTEHNIGKHVRFLNGYLADLYFIDGSQLEPTSFGAFDDNGVWQAAAYDGSYGTNGFHLFDFANETTVGNDSSGNDNDWTVNNISTTAGAGNDVLRDVPANGDSSDDTGAGGEVSGNYPLLNSLDQAGSSSISNGNLDMGNSQSGSKWGNVRATIGAKSGKYYAEYTCTASSGSFRQVVGVVSSTVSNSGAAADNVALNNLDDSAAYFNNGQKSLNGTTTNYGASWTTNDVIGIALDIDNTTVTFYKNGTSQGSASTALASDAPLTFAGGMISSSETGSWNFGARSFAYTAPSGFKALNTASLPTPTVADGSDYFDTKLYTGNSSTQSITGLEFSPDLIWLKERNGTRYHALCDSVRGDGKLIYTNTSSFGEQDIGSSVVSLTDDGFDLGFNASYSAVSHNHDTKTHVAWAWNAGGSSVTNTDGSINSTVRANQTAGFSIVSVTADAHADGSTVGHGLGAKPLMIIEKRRDAASPWYIQHSGLGDMTGSYLAFSTAAKATDNTWNLAEPTSTVMSIDPGYLNADTNADVIYYCFAPVAGYSAFGSYEGNGSSDGPFVYTGFRPRWIMVKRTDATGGWVVCDTARSTYNVVDTYLYPNQDWQENYYGAVVLLDVLSNGFKLRSSTTAELNASSGTYIYAAFSENAFFLNGGLAR